MKYYLSLEPGGIIRDALTFPYEDYVEIDHEGLLPGDLLGGWYRWDGTGFAVDDIEFKRLNKGEIMAAVVDDYVKASPPSNDFVEGHYAQLQTAITAEWTEHPGYTYPAKTVLLCDGVLWYTPSGALAILNYRPGTPGTTSVWMPNTRPKDMGALPWLTAEHLPETGYLRVSPANGKTYRNTQALPNGTNNYDPANVPATWTQA